MEQDEKKTLDDKLLHNDISGDELREMGFLFKHTYQESLIFHMDEYHLVCDEISRGVIKRNEDGEMFPERGIYQPWLSYLTGDDVDKKIGD